MDMKRDMQRGGGGREKRPYIELHVHLYPRVLISVFEFKKDMRKGAGNLQYW